jgi:hypothetical protein
MDAEREKRGIKTKQRKIKETKHKNQSITRAINITLPSHSVTSLEHKTKQQRRINTWKWERRGTAQTPPCNTERSGGEEESQAERILS